MIFLYVKYSSTHTDSYYTLVLLSVGSHDNDTQVTRDPDRIYKE